MSTPQLSSATSEAILGAVTEQLRQTVLPALLLAVLGAWLPSCSSDCGCGAPSEAPLFEHDLAFAGDHTVDDGCICRCDDGPPVHRPLDDEGTCEHEGAKCEVDGELVPLTCS